MYFVPVFNCNLKCFGDVVGTKIVNLGDYMDEINLYATIKHKNLISSILGGAPARQKALAISNPHDFRQVSSIIDVDIVPETCRRVRLLKHGSEKPLGFYIRDGTSVKVTQNGTGKMS